MKKVFILHGWSYSTDKWQQFNNLLKDGGLEVVQLNIPGLTSKIDRAWTLDDYIQWLKDLADKEKSKIRLIGHSNGGRIALAFSAQYPDKASSLVLIDSAGIYHNELQIRLKRALFGTAAKIGKKLAPSDTLRRLLYRVAGEQDYQQASPEMRQTMTNLISADLTNQLDKISAQTLIIWGSDDQITPLSDGKKIHQLIRGSKLSIIHNAKHSPQFTHPEQVAKIINEYL